MNERGHVYFHAPCFDGVVSAVFAMELLRWEDPYLHPTGYEVRAHWLEDRLEAPTAVVDFLFHPRAIFWADHHRTTFLNEIAARYHSEHPRPEWIFDPAAGSCAALLFRSFPQLAHHEQLARWADKIDAARYESVNEAIFGTSPALLISKGLAVGDGYTNSTELVRRLSRRPLASVAADRDVRERFERVQRDAEHALREFDRHARLEAGDIIVADLESDAGTNRYAPYHQFPGARYSVVLFRTSSGAKITAMRNPWREFASVPLGNIFERYGGGGHDRVASLLVPPERDADANVLLRAIVDDLRSADCASNRSDA
jgi:hypothetical protein